MNISREVIIDLMPAYLANECSAASRALVEDHFRRNPQDAADLRRAMLVTLPLPSVPTPAPAAGEMKAFREARRRLALRSWVMGFAIFFSLAPFSFYTNGTQSFFLFREDPRSAGAYAAVAAVLWAVYAHLRTRARGV